jgi:hypothetical protein
VRGRRHLRGFIVRTIAAGLLGFAFLVAAASAADKGGESGDKDKAVVYKVTADEIAKQFKDDPAAAKKKYGAKPAPTIEITGTAALIIGPANDREILVENESKIPIRMKVERGPANFPAKFTATATYKDFFDMAKELSLTSSKINYK